MTDTMFNLFGVVWMGLTPQQEQTEEAELLVEIFIRLFEVYYIDPEFSHVLLTITALIGIQQLPDTILESNNSHTF